MDTWLVTGGGGFLGANAGLFLRGRAESLGLVRRESGTGSTFVTTIEADLSDVSRAVEVVEAARPSVILHCAAVSRHEDCESDPARAELINVNATRELARAAHEIGAQFIYVSTDAVFDGATGIYNEDALPNPFSVYGQTKLEGEHVALLEANALVVRTNFFGWSPSGRSSILEFFYNSLTRGEVVKGYTDFVVTSMYAQHLMEAIWTLAERDAHGVFHVASKDPLSKYDFAIAAADVFDLDSSLVFPTSEDVEPREWAKSRDISLDTSKFESFTQTPSPTQRQGLTAARLDASTVRVWLQDGKMTDTALASAASRKPLESDWF
ncbi:MAG: SDR family oxidoreductase [Actinobacteria bacterium]|nr:SDR family oxidoreductase [Actinomycetota bacterium]